MLSVVGCIWFFAFVRQIFRAYGRFHRNALAPCRGAAALPALPLAPQLPGALRRRLRTVTLAVLESHGAPVYLETHKAVSTRIYAHLGFHTVDTCAIPGTGITQYAMLRPARRPLR